MNEYEFRNEMLNLIKRGDQDTAIRNVLIKFKESGGKQEDAYRIMLDILNYIITLDDEEKEDSTRDICDVIIGHVSEESRVWKNVY